MQPSDVSVSCPACGDAESEIGGRLRLLRTLCISVFLTMPLFWNLHPLAQLAIASVLQFWPGAYFYKGAYKTLRQGVLGMDFLVADVFDLLPQLEAAHEKPYDFIILDPPAFTKSRRTANNAEKVRQVYGVHLAL